MKKMLAMFVFLNFILATSVGKAIWIKLKKIYMLIIQQLLTTELQEPAGLKLPNLNNKRIDLKNIKYIVRKVL